MSKDKEKVQRLVQSVSNLEMQFKPPSENNVLDALQPLQHQQRAKAILELNEQLNEFKPPEEGEEERLKDAMKKDYAGLQKDVTRLVQTTFEGLQQIYDLLPSKMDMADDKKWTNEFAQIVEDPSGVQKVEEAMMNFLQKMEELRESGPLDAKVTIAVVHMDKDDSEVKKYLLDPQQRFSDIVEMIGYADDEDEDIPEFWIKTLDPSRNSVTKSGEVWELQPMRCRLRDAIQKATGSDGKSLKVSIVLQSQDYIIALVKDDTLEHTRSIELESKKGPLAKQYLATKFRNKSIGRVCNLEDGSDAANLPLDKRRFEPRTNALYVELAST